MSSEQDKRMKGKRLKTKDKSLKCGFIVSYGIGIHRQQAFAQEGFVAVGQVNKGYAVLEIFLKGNLVLVRVSVCVIGLACKQVGSHIVAGEQPIVVMNLVIDALGKYGKELGLVHVLQFVPSDNARVPSGRRYPSSCS